MVSAPIEPSSTLSAIVHKITHGLEEITENDLKELRSIADCDTKHDIIPSLNRRFLQKAPTTKLQVVRFTGMVQDMLEPEYYISKINGITTHFRDYHPSLSNDDTTDIPSHKLAERQPLVVVPVPFVGVFGRSDQESTHDMDMIDKEFGSFNYVASNKRSIDQVDESNEEIRRAPHSTLDNSSNIHSRSHYATHTEWWQAGMLGSNPSECAVLAKLYYEQTNTTDCHLKLNELVELIGVLSIDPFEADFEGTIDDQFGLDRLVIPPPSLLPRLHVLCVNHLQVEDTSKHIPVVAEDARSRVLQILTEQLGSETTATALLLVLLSMAERRQDAFGTFVPLTTMSETTLGCASLNLILPNEAACCEMQGALQRILQQFLPIVATCSLADLGGTLVSPAKTDAGRLIPSPLQLPKGATIIINEATLQAGPLCPRSLETLAALSNLSRSHTVPYRFDSLMAHQWEADYRVIVLSVSNRLVGSKLMPCSLQRVVCDQLPTHTEMLSKGAVHVVQSYLSEIRTMSSPCHKIVLDDVLEDAQREFVQRRVDARQLGKAECGEKDLHRWITLTTLQARSRGATRATMVDWNASLCLDEAMVA